MKRSHVILSLFVAVAILSYGVFALQTNLRIVDDINSRLNSLESQVTRARMDDGDEVDLTEEEQAQLDEAFQNLIDARRQQVDTMQEVGLISEQEAEWKHSHINLMEEYKTDYIPPAPGQRMGRMMRMQEQPPAEEPPAEEPGAE